MLTYTIGTKASNGRKAYLHDAMQETFGHDWDVNPVRPSDFHMTIKSVPFGPMSLSQATLSQAQVTNTAKLSSQTPDHPYNIYILNRRQKIMTKDKTVVLDPGDVTITDSAVATTIITEEPYTTIGLTVPASLLRTYIPQEAGRRAIFR